MPFVPFFDPTYFLIIIGLVISGIASAYVQSTFNKYDEFETKRRISGAEVARYILNHESLQNVDVEGIRGQLSDHYDPSSKVLRLSESTHDRRSISAVTVAAHEAGHAIQDKVGYSAMRLRTAFVPIVNFGQGVSIPMIFLGVFLGYNQTLINIGIALFATALIFQLITLPVEFDASNRALHILENSQILSAEEMPAAKKVLRAAALTYVAGAIGSFLSLLRLLLLFGGGNRRD